MNCAKNSSESFSANQHHLQEPGLNSELLAGLKYVRPGNFWEPDQNLHIFGKIDVNGKNEHPLYSFLKVSLTYNT